MKIGAKFFALLFFLAGAAPETAGAAAEIQVLIRQNIEPVKVIGLIISPNKTVQKSDVQLKKSDEGLIVSIPVQKSDGGDDAYATAMALTAEGDAFFADLRPLSLAGIERSFLNLPICETKIKDSEVQATISLGNPGMIETLIDIRRQRREVLQQILSESMEGKFLKKIQTMEQGLGLQSGEPLSAEVNPYELTDRLNRLLIALRNAKVTR